MDNRFADRLADIEPFRVVEVLTRAKQLAAAGRDSVHMEAGEPDFSTVDTIVNAAKASLDRGETHYTPAAGIPELRQAISQYYRTDYGLDIAPERIMITPGASGALLLLAGLLINPGEGMLMTDPGYPCNRHFLRLVEGEGQLVPVGPEDRFQLSAEKAEQYWRPNTKGIMVASPANPTGEILTSTQLQDLHSLCERKRGSLIVDEIYHGLNYDEAAPSILSITDKAFVINSFSKYFGMTGWRLGWLVAPPEAVPHLEKMAQNFFISMSTTAQYAALAAFDTTTRLELNRRRDEFAARRDFLLPALRELGFEIPHCPAGALYLYAGIERFKTTSQRLCLDLLENHGIAITPGEDFGRYQAEQHVRFAYTTGLDRLQEAVLRLRRLYG
ncbi:Putative N-acetyl-LL-diaminopimelate aminotransferase [Zhongshania aliphaticivorans]|uniref:Aminotransferase n=1 Tax=Zhongshania aliphaticivorans TaxID=1470434 RepID=A0A5S9QTZ3_9GAMM|nr:pyridoxal phosphate-dependent aminotransferase [Zhongshania aliphaticivorans]CAA0114842.1 Putative N-acetyl-LL-diaminopimelate aminotransferase [Zhongshania aliphaticivorans]CAA0123038.1 Putative N-acetyl-LL-diaminopimelate aminotransferase [Zhongshania aliphaticivorans]